MPHMQKFLYMPHILQILAHIFAFSHIFSHKKTLEKYGLLGARNGNHLVSFKLIFLETVSKCTQTHYIDAKVKKNSGKGCTPRVFPLPVNIILIVFSIILKHEVR